MVEGKKRVYLCDQIVKDFKTDVYGDMYFQDLSRRKYSFEKGAVYFDLEAGDLLYFNSNDYHEVYNLTEISIGISGSTINPFFINALQSDEKQKTWRDILESGTEDLLREKRYTLKCIKNGLVRRSTAKKITSNIKNIYDFYTANAERKNIYKIIISIV